MKWKVFSFKRTITKYLLQELISPFLLGLLIFTFVLLMEKVLELIELVIKKGVELNVVLELVLYIMPSFLVLTVPMAVLVATLTAFGRLSTDSEVTAMKASGISLYALMQPVMLFAFIACGATFFLYSKALPWGNHHFRVTLYELARTKATVGLKEQVFNNTFPGLVIYIDTISDIDNSFEGVMISDSRDPREPQILFADRGKLISDEQELRVILRLKNGIRHPKQMVTPLKYQQAEFMTFDILLSLQDDKKDTINIPLTDREMKISELWENYNRLRQQNKNQPPPIEDSQNSSQKIGIGAGIWWVLKRFLWDSFGFLDRLSSPYLVELHKRFSIPLACLVFGLIGTPLGIHSRRAGKSGGYAISVVLLLIYYIFITAGESLGDSGKLPVFLAVWTPNVLLGGAGFFLLVRAARQ